jgi:DNA-binding NtrC family response regulator
MDGTVSRTILIVDDHSANRELIREALAASAYQIGEAQTASQALEYMRSREADIVITDVRMPEISGVDLLKRLRSDYPGTVVILVTGFATVANAVEAMRLGAHDYMTQPLDLDQLRLVVRGAVERVELRRATQALNSAPERRAGFESILGQADELLHVLDQASRVAPTDSTVLIQGETGTGKELLARGIHAISGRRTKPFVTINCGAIPKDLMESELFGHVKGSFTGALMDRKGQVEVANGGTLFLDEIGEMSLESQVKLLRLLQNGEVQKVGAVCSARVDIRVIAATHRVLPAMVQDGRFREDLYYRLNVIPLLLPSLRERPEDIPELVNFFHERNCHKYGREDLALPPHLLPRFSAYRWPGNIRELENTIERIVLLTRGNEVVEKDLPSFLRVEAPPREAFMPDLPAQGICLSGLERDILLRALQKFNWNQSRAARFLGISRHTLIYRMSKHNLAREPVSIADAGVQRQTSSRNGFTVIRKDGTLAS